MQVGSDTCMLRLTYIRMYACIAIQVIKTIQKLYHELACRAAAAISRMAAIRASPKLYSGNEKRREHRRAVHVQHGKLRIRDSAAKTCTMQV